MPLLVVGIAPEESDALTLKEWDALLERDRIVFEAAEHPLAERLRARSRAVELGGSAPDPSDARAAFVVAPTSPALVELARAGATITAGVVDAVDDLTAAHGAYLARRGSAALGGLALVMARLRSADGCPWDQEQTHGSLRIHLLEEAHEVLDAIDRGQFGHELEEELGDLLLQVAFHAQLAADDGRFDLAGVAHGIVAKLVHRHPHVFGDRSVADAGEVVRNWEEIKREEKDRSGPFDDVPVSLPALLAAYKIQKRAAAVGFDGDAATAREQLDEALASEPLDVGKALFCLVVIARAAGVDPEGALREATAAFRAGYEKA